MLNNTTFQQSMLELCADYNNLQFLLAISGGADSMVLLNLFTTAGLQFQVAHINYGLRGKDSEDDQRLVENICKKSEIPIHIYSVSKKDNKPNNSIQDWARKLRYDFFRKIQKKENIDFIVTAHHLNDQLETFMIHLSKASGIRGLSGIPANDNSIIRPLLGFSKQEIYDFAQENNIEFREDVSNQKNDYLRNKIRNGIVPLLTDLNENFLENFRRSLLYLNQTKKFVEENIWQIEEKIMSHEEDSILIHKELFFSQTDFVQFEILRKFGFILSQEIAKIKKAETGKQFFSGEYYLVIDHEVLIIKKTKNTRIKISGQEIILTLNNENEIIIPENLNSETAFFNWQFDPEKIQFPLKLRRRKEGDLFYPLGMIGKKNISKFFKDEKIPILARQKIWLLCDKNDQVLGVIPFRQDRRCVATETTSQIIKVKSQRSL